MIEMCIKLVATKSMKIRAFENLKGQCVGIEAVQLPIISLAVK